MDEKIPKPVRRVLVTERIDEGDDEPKTDPKMTIDAEYFKRNLGESLSEHDRKMTIRGWLMAFAAAVASVATVVVLAIVFIDNRVQAQTDAGTREHANRITTLEQQRTADRQENNEKIEELRSGATRMEKKMNALLDRLDVKDPAPTPKDAGR